MTNPASKSVEERYQAIHAKLPGDGVLDIPPGAGTWDGFMDWATSDLFPEKRRIDFVDGRLHFDFGPEELLTHNLLKVALLAAIGSHARETGLGEVLGSFCRYANRNANMATQPDVFLCTFDGLETGRIRYVEREPGSGEYYSVQGELDLIIEVVGYDTADYDLQVLPQVYHAAGLRELWLADARDDGMRFQILTPGKDGWKNTPPDADGFRASEVLGRRIRIDRGIDKASYPDYDVMITR